MRRDATEIYEASETNPVDDTQLGDIIDHVAAGYHLGGSPNARNLHILITEDLAGATSVQFKLQVDAAEDFSDDPEIIALTPVIVAADFVEGAEVIVPLPPNGKRYSRILPVVAGSAASAGLADIFLSS